MNRFPPNAIKEKRISARIVSIVIAMIVLTVALCGVSLFGVSASDNTCTCGALGDTHIYKCPKYTPITATLDSTATLTAKLFTTGDRIPGTEVTLTSSGIEDYSWTYNETRYLHVSLDGLDDVSAGEYYRLVITMDYAVYSRSIHDHTDTWASSFEIIENPYIPVNSGGKLTHESGTSAVIVYDIDPLMKNLSLDLGLDYNWLIWDGSKDSYIGYAYAYLGEVNQSLIKAELIKVSDSEQGLVDTAKLNTAKTTKSINTSSNVSASLMVGQSTSNMAPGNSMNAKSLARLRFPMEADAFYREYVMKFVMPYTVIDGVCYGMDFNPTLTYISTGIGKADYTYSKSFDPTTGTLVYTFTFQNLLMTNSFFYIGIKATDETFALAKTQELTLKGGKVYCYKNGSSTHHKTCSLDNITLDCRSEPKIEEGSTSTVTLSTKTGDNVGIIDFFGVKNSGGVVSGPVTYHAEYDINNQMNVGVTSLKLMIPLKSTIDVHYTMVDRSGNLVVTDGLYEGLSNVSTTGNKHASGIVFSRQNLPEEHRSYFFKSITYVMSIPAGAELFLADSVKSGGGTTYGYSFADSTSDKNSNRYMVYYGDHVETIMNGETPDSTFNAIAAPRIKKQSFNTRTTVSLRVDSVRAVYSDGTKSSNASIVAGDKISVHATVSMFPYPYTAKSVVDKIRVGILLPVDATVISGDIVAKYTKKGKQEISTNVLPPTKVQVGDGYKNFWIIELDPTAKIGYFTEALQMIDTGDAFEITIPFSTEVTTSVQTITVDESFFVAGLGQGLPSSGGNIKKYITKDAYDLIGNGSSDANSSYVARTSSSSASTYISITPPVALLEISDGLSVKNNPSSTLINSTSEHDRFVYKLIVDCTRGGTANDFFYFIPIPKAGSRFEFVENAHSLSLNLLGAVELSAEGSNMEIAYSTVNGMTYDSAKLSDAWLDASEVDDWGDVTLIRIKPVDNASLVNGSQLVLTAQLGFSSTVNFISNAGTEVFMSSQGYYEYTLGTTTNAGDRATVGSRIRLVYEADPTSITLTAAKDGLPVTGTRAAAISIYSILGVTALELDHKFTLDSVNANGLTLVDGDDDYFAEMNSERSNKEFGISVSLGTAAEQSVLASSSLELGTLVSESDSDLLNLSLRNGNIITENASSKTVAFRLVSDNGITIPLTVIIRRELTPAEIKDSSILSGVYYRPQPSSNTSVTVCANSSITANFVLDYVPSNYDCPVINIGGVIEGVKVIMIDWSDAEHPKYYYADLAPSITLTSFRSMADPNNSFVYDNSGSSPVSRSLLFIINLSDSGVSESGDYTVSLNQSAKSGVDINATLDYKTVSERSFSLKSASSEIKLGESFTLSYSTQSEFIGSGDYLYNDKSWSLVISGRSLPLDMYLSSADGTSYYRNKDGEFIIPLGNLQNVTSGRLSLTPVSDSMTGSAQLMINLWVCATADPTLPHSGHRVSSSCAIGIEPSDEPPSFEITALSSSSMSLSDISKALKVCTNSSSMNGCVLKLEIQLKVGYAYVTQTAAVTGITHSTGSSHGIYTLATDYDTYEITFSPTLRVGTYRLLFTVESSDGSTLTVVRGFVISE